MIHRYEAYNLIIILPIGYTFTIPESVMGLTFLAIGGCTPELLTASIMARKGDNIQLV